MTIHGTYPLVISQFAIENGYLYVIYLFKKKKQIFLKLCQFTKG